MRQPVVRIEFRRLQDKSARFVKSITSAKAVKRPGQTARPARIAAIALLSRLPQKLAGLEIKDAFVRRAAVSAHQRAPRCHDSVVCASSSNARSPVSQRSIKDDADVHHDVDEVGIFAVE